MPTFSQGRLRLARIGAIAALGQAFIALSNMPVVFDKRVIIAPVLSLGYAALGLLPIVVGYRQGRRVALEGVPTQPVGSREVVGGAICGAIAGGGLSILAILIDNFNLRDPLINWSPRLLDLLAFGRGTATAVIAWPLICAVLGSAGGTLHLLPDRARRAAVTMVVTVVGAALLEPIIVDIGKGPLAERVQIGAISEAITDRLYAPRGGVAWASALLLAIASGAVGAVGHEWYRRARSRIVRQLAEDPTRHPAEGAGEEDPTAESASHSLGKPNQKSAGGIGGAGGRRRTPGPAETVRDQLLQDRARSQSQARHHLRSDTARPATADGQAHQRVAR